MEYVFVGKIVSTHGIKGEVKVKSETSFAEERYKKGNTLYIKKEKQYIPIHIDSHRVHKGLDLVCFNSFRNINEVLEFVGYDVYMNKEDRNVLSDDEFYYDELIGMHVFDMQDVEIGQVVDIREVPQGIILEIKSKQKNILIPFVDEFIKSVDKMNGKIQIDPIEGLLWKSIF